MRAALRPRRCAVLLRSFQKNVQLSRVDVNYVADCWDLGSGLTKVDDISSLYNAAKVKIRLYRAGH